MTAPVPACLITSEPMMNTDAAGVIADSVIIRLPSRCMLRLKTSASPNTPGPMRPALACVTLAAAA